MNERKKPWARRAQEQFAKGQYMLKDTLYFFRFLFFDFEKKQSEIKNRDKELSVFNSISRFIFVLRFFLLKLETIFKICGTDKHRSGGHWYAPHYALFFKPFRLKAIRILEIGIGGYAHSIGGRSINAWRCYFPFAHLVACDIQDKTMLQRSRSTVCLLDQSDPAQLRAVASKHGPFEIIIDDGSHLNDHQILTFQVLFQTLKNGGVYVVEDTQTSYLTSYGGRHADSPDFDKTCTGYFLEMSKHLNACEFEPQANQSPDMRKYADEISTISFHHNLIIIKKDTMKKWSNLK
jgi:hypothetical protein